MEIITQEHLASNFIKYTLGILWDTYKQDKKAHETAQSFDEYVWERLEELGMACYDRIGEMYGDLDSAINEVN